MRELNSNLSGNEVCYTACSLLVILKNLCSKLHSQKGFDFILVSYKTPGQHLDLAFKSVLLSLDSGSPGQVSRHSQIL